MTGFALEAVDHVQLAAPPGSEDALRAFYGGLLGMTEEPKPPALAARGGCWFGAGTVVLHLGVESDFRPARKAHPGLRVTGLEVRACFSDPRGPGAAATHARCVVDRRRSPLRSPHSALRSHAPAAPG